MAVREPAFAKPTARQALAPPKIRLQNVQNREQEHPDNVDEVPIKAGALEEPVLLRRDLTSERPDQTSDQKNDPDSHVAAVKSGEYEEARTHDARGIEPETFVKKVSPFIGLVAEEERT